MSINSRNAAATIARVEDEMRKAWDERNAAATETVTEVDDVLAAEPMAEETVDMEPETAEQEQTETATEEGTSSDYAKLKREYEILDKNFKNIQRVMTPVWEENSKLRKEVETLASRVAQQEEHQETRRRNDFNSRYESLKDAVPEGAELVQALQEEVQSLKASILDRNAQSRIDPKVANERAMQSILAAHPDMHPDIIPKDFWKFIEAQGAMASVYESILSDPGSHQEGAQIVIDLINAYKANRPAAPKPKRPNDVAAPARPSQSTVDPNSSRQPEGLLTESQIQSLMKEASRATPERGREITKLIQNHMRASSPMRT